MLTGETCEWSIAEYARDAAALGRNKTLIIMGHVGSERYGMQYIARCLQEKLPELQVQYFHTPEVYTYTDS
jgi:creatinine amidohydrolase/Fe(II)-dependent formamide hydrolase-like protein